MCLSVHKGMGLLRMNLVKLNFVSICNSLCADFSLHCMTRCPSHRGMHCSMKWSWSPCLMNKVKLSLCLTKNYAMKTYMGMEVQLHAFLTSALDGYEWSTSCPSHLTPGERAPGYTLDKRLGGTWRWYCKIVNIFPKFHLCPLLHSVAQGYQQEVHCVPYNLTFFHS